MEKNFSQILKLSQPYFSEVKKRFLYCFLFFLTIFLTSFFFSENIIKFFLSILKFEDVQIVITSPFQFFSLAINMGISIAIVATFPVIIWNIFSFFYPALTKKERVVFIKIIFCSVVFFIGGFFFGLSILNYVLKFLAEYNNRMGLVNMWDVGLFSSQIFLTATLMGLIFQFPIILTVLVKWRIVELEILKKKRKWAILLAFVISALLPPTDGVSLLIMALPLILIFEITLLYNKNNINLNINKKNVRN